MRRILSIYLSYLFLLISTTGFSQTWEIGSNFPSGEIERVFHFVINDTLYVGGGRSQSGTNVNGIWSYIPDLQTWEQKSDFPGEARRNAFAFSDGQFGYMGMGFNGSKTLSDFYKYDPDIDRWTPLPDFPGSARNHTVALSGGGKGYIVSGGDSDQGLYFDDLWEFDFESQSWTLLSPIPSTPRWRAFGFILNDKIYVGGGSQYLDPAYTDFWEFDPATGIWTEKSPFPSALAIGCSFFALQNQGFVIEGTNNADDTEAIYDTGLYIYNPETDVWTKGSDFIGAPRILGFGNVVGDQAIVGLGQNLFTDQYFDDIYLYSDINTGVFEMETSPIKIFPNPASDQIHINFDLENQNHISIKVYDLNGQEMATWIEDTLAAGHYSLQFSLDALSSGTYQLYCKTGSQYSSKSLVVVR